jgi:hypothetical protein
LTDATTEAFQIIIGSTTALTALGTSGNVGIGTETPVSTWLTGFDPSTGNGTFKLTSEGWIVTPFLTGLAGYYPGQGARPIIWADGTGTNIQSWDSDATDGVTIRSSDGARRLFVKENGNVGIGNVSPESLLHIKGADPILLIQDDSTGTAQASSTLRLGESGAAGVLDIYWDIKQAADDLNTHLEINHSSNGNALTILDNKNVGIGTESPGANLYVSGSNADATDKPTMVSESVFTIKPVALNSGNLSFAQVDSGNSIGMQYTNGPGTANWDISMQPFGGNVGIGTTSPGSKLEIAGANSTTNATALFSIQKNEEGYGLFSGLYGSGASWLQGGTANGATDYSIVIQPNGGNVGIGTTSPRTKLEIGVYGSLGSVTNKVISATFDGGYSLLNSLQYNVNAFIGTTFGTTDIFAQTSGEVLKNFYVGLVASNSYFNGSRYSITQGGAERLTVAIGGNVGIGTATPQSKLQVAGGIQMADDTATASATKVGTMRYRTGTEYVEVDGVELVTNGDFATDTGWTKGTGWTILGGTADAATATSDFTQTVSFTLGQTYRLTYTVSNYSAGAVRTSLGAYVANTPISANGNYTDIFTPTNVSSNSLLYFEGQSGFTGSIDNVSMVEVTSEDASYADMCMQTGASTYEWVNIVRNTY